MREFVFTAIVLGSTNVFVIMAQWQNSPISLYNNNNGVETFTTYEVDGIGYYYSGGRGAISRSISGGIDTKGGGVSAPCDISRQTGRYTCCGIRCTCEKY